MGRTAEPASGGSLLGAQRRGPAPPPRRTPSAQPPSFPAPPPRGVAPAAPSSPVAPEAPDATDDSFSDDGGSQIGKKLSKKDKKEEERRKKEEAKRIQKEKKERLKMEKKFKPKGKDIFQIETEFIPHVSSTLKCL